MIHMILFDVFQKFISQNSRDEWISLVMTYSNFMERLDP